MLDEVFLLLDPRTPNIKISSVGTRGTEREEGTEASMRTSCSFSTHSSGVAVAAVVGALVRRLFVER